PWSVDRRTVLAELVFALQSGDGDVEPDDPFEHPVEIWFRKVLHTPRIRAASLVTLRQPKQQTPQPIAVLDKPHRPISMDINVVPGRYSWPRRIPARRNIGVGTAKNRQHLLATTQVLDLGVRARQMAEQMQLSTAVLDQERDMACDQTRCATAHEHAEFM